MCPKKNHTLRIQQKETDLKTQKTTSSFLAGTTLAFLSPSSEKWGLIYRYNCNKTN